VASLLHGRTSVYLAHLESIAGFTILFVLVTAFRFLVHDFQPRLSYFGVQMPSLFTSSISIHSQIEPSLSVARDRVVGMLLGLIMMWLVFDQTNGSIRRPDMKRRSFRRFDCWLNLHESRSRGNYQSGRGTQLLPA